MTFPRHSYLWFLFLAFTALDCWLAVVTLHGRPPSPHGELFAADHGQPHRGSVGLS
jgi:hypothetical protein